MKSTYHDYSWSFLAASPSFAGAYFEEAVILLLEDNEDGSFGVIMNKSLGKTLGELNESFIGTDLENVEVFDGGPIAKEKISIAVCYDEGKDEGAFSFGIPPEKAIGIIKKNDNAKVAAFAGYAGWTANQLQSEISEGTWIVSNADVNVLFEVSNGELWKYLVKRESPQFEDLTPPKNSPDLN